MALKGNAAQLYNSMILVTDAASAGTQRGEGLTRFDPFDLVFLQS